VAATTFRLFLLRFAFLGNVVGLGINAWPALLAPAKLVEPIPGVAFSLWATLSTLSIIGLRYPMQMLPLLLFQFTYKTIWLLTVALPLSSSGQWSAGAPSLFRIMLVGAVADLLIIPWPFVLANYLRKAGEPWKAAPARA
jgi:hypothetical protein